MKRIIVIILSLLIMISVLPASVLAAVPTYRYKATSPVRVTNVSMNDYWRFANVLHGNLYVEDGTLIRVQYDYDNRSVCVEYLTSDFKVKKTVSIKSPFDSVYGFFGGFHCGKDYNFLVFGQSNLEEDDSKEVFRTVKYSKDWKELGHLSMYGEYTTVPFIAGSLRMDEKDGMLLVFTAHEMYKSDDGNRHQSNYNWTVNIEDMSRIGEWQIGYVSHSFNQFIKCDDDYYYICDHGDAYPRSVLIRKYVYDFSYSRAPEEAIEPIKMFGTLGANETKTRVGGFELSKDNVLTAVAAIRMESEEQYSWDEQKNIYLVVAPKSDLQSYKMIQFTDYPSTDKWYTNEVRTPHLVKLDDDRFLLLWEQQHDELRLQYICAVMVDREGNKISRVIKLKGNLSSVEPAVMDNKVIWYTDDDTDLYYYRLDCSSAKSLEQYDQSGSIDGELNIDYTYERIYGNNRYQTALYAADYLKSVQKVDKFDSVVVTTGQAFPDALSGSYLANKYNAPILLIREDAAHDVREFIRNNVAEGGNIFILGGTNAVPDEWLVRLDGYNIERIAGSNRYGTNIDVLKKLEYKGGDILVCVGTNFADSLSCSAVDMPMMLVGTSLNDAQKQFLGECEDVRFHIVGGTGAVTSAVESELKQYGKVRERIAGSNRYETSAKIAERFFTSAEKIVVAYGKNYPDGLSGGCLAYALKAPLILAESNNTAAGYGAEIAGKFGCDRFVVLGGPALITHETVRWMIRRAATGE